MHQTTELKGRDMTDIKVEKVADPTKRTLPVFKEVESLLERIRRRAFQMSSGRGFGDGHALDDWLAAEREICWPAGELVEEENKYVLSLTLPGFEPADISVTATPCEIIVHAQAKTERKGEEGAKKGEGKVCWSEFRSNDVYRRIELAKAIDVQSVSASLKNGVLKLVATKAEKKAERPAHVIPISSAA
jgi:HSP20 family molecular chaperone IbpA